MIFSPCRLVVPIGKICGVDGAHSVCFWCFSGPSFVTDNFVNFGTFVGITLGARFSGSTAEVRRFKSDFLGLQSLTALREVAGGLEAKDASESNREA